jgi:hypothetical protein
VTAPKNKRMNACDSRPSSLRSWLARAEARHAKRTILEELTSATLAVIPVVVLSFVLLGPAFSHAYMPDFKVFWEAGRAVLAGHNPYPHANTALLAQGRSFVYPAPAAVLMVPLAWLPFSVAAALWTVVLLASIPAALLLLGVRDWRCHGAALLTIWTLNGIYVGSVSPILFLGLAALWRYRDRPLVTACLAASLVCLKVYLWPVLVWMALSGRRRAAAQAVAVSAILCVSAWALIDFHGLASYPSLLAHLASAEQAASYSPLALVLGLGVDPMAARLLVGATGGVVLWFAAAAQRRGRLGQVDSFTLCLVASLVLSPVVWPHYFLLLLVPVSIAHKRLSPPWLLAIASWVSPGLHSKGPTYVALTLLVAGATLFATRLPNQNSGTDPWATLPRVGHADA